MFRNIEDVLLFFQTIGTFLNFSKAAVLKKERASPQLPSRINVLCINKDDWAHRKSSL